MAFPNGSISISDIRGQLYNITNSADGTSVSGAVSFGDLYKDGTYLKDYGSGANSGLPSSGAISLNDLKGKYAVHTKAAGGSNSSVDSSGLHPSDIRTSHITRTAVNGTYNNALNVGTSTTVKHVIDVTPAGQVDGVDQTGTSPANADGAAGGVGITATNPVVLSNNQVNANVIRGGGGQGGYGQVLNNRSSASYGPNVSNGSGNSGNNGPGGNNVSVGSSNKGGNMPSPFGSVGGGSNSAYGSVSFTTQYQGSPAPVSGNINCNFGRQAGTSGTGAGSAQQANPDSSTFDGSWNNGTVGSGGSPGGPGASGGTGGTATAGNVSNNPGRNAGANYNAGTAGNAGGPTRINGGSIGGTNGSYFTAYGRGGNTSPDHSGNSFNRSMNMNFAETHGDHQQSYNSNWSVNFNKAGGSSGNAGSTTPGGSGHTSGTVNNQTESAAARSGGAAGSKYSGNVTLGTF